MLAGSALPAKRKITPDHPWFGKPSFDLRYDPDAARALMREQGYGPDQRAAISVIIASGGGGQMVPMPMNEALQEMLRAGPRAPIARGAAAINIAIPTMNPTKGWIIDGRELAPLRGVNWGKDVSPAVQAQLASARCAFGESGNRAEMARLHESLVEEAAALFVVHDLNPRACCAPARLGAGAQLAQGLHADILWLRCRSGGAGHKTILFRKDLRPGPRPRNTDASGVAQTGIRPGPLVECHGGPAPPHGRSRSFPNGADGRLWQGRCDRHRSRFAAGLLATRSRTTEADRAESWYKPPRLCPYAARR